MPLDGDSGAQGRLNLQGECIVGLYRQTCGAVATTDEKIPEGRAADESAQAQNATAVVHADIDDIVGINGDLKLLAGFQQVVAVVSAQGRVCPWNIVEVGVMGCQADDAFILACLVNAAGIYAVGSHVDGVACYGILNCESDFADLSRGGVIGLGYDRARKLEVALGFIQPGIDGFLGPLSREEACA